MKLLAIESSCDETAAAVVELNEGIIRVKSNIIASQIKIHQKYGGVVPEIASRKHIEVISDIAEQAVTECGESFNSIDAIGVTYAPGLVGALLVGVNYAKSLSFALQKPLVPVHHIEGHISALYIENPQLKPPFVCLVASGGHSSIVHVKNFVEFELAAKTRDDAAGEAFDKIARVLDLGYPGGPAIQKCAETGDCKAIDFPRVAFNDNLDFSFSGVKTAVINYIHKSQQRGEQINKHHIAASFQQAVCEVLSDRLILAAQKMEVDTISIAGGVAANRLLRKLVAKRADENNMKFFTPSPALCTDNAVMIGARAIHMLQYDDKCYKVNTGLDAYATKGFGD